MINRNVNAGELLEVNDLNTIRVCVDRSETALTETGLNAWRPGLVGPPHLHEAKEQMFLILNGEGTINVGEESYVVQPGDLAYIPAKMPHQTVVKGNEELQYFLFNAYLDASKEGHATFKEHIEIVRNIRSQQAKEQQAGDIYKDAGKPVKQPRLAKNVFESSGNEKVLIKKSDTQKCEAVTGIGSTSTQTQTFPDKEQTIYIAKGHGTATVGDESGAVTPGDVVFVPADTPFSVRSENGQITYVALNTFV